MATMEMRQLLFGQRLLLTAYCLLLTAYCFCFSLLAARFSILPSADFVLVGDTECAPKKCAPGFSPPVLGITQMHPQWGVGRRRNYFLQPSISDEGNQNSNAAKVFRG